MLVLAEACAYPYGRRADALSAEAIAALNKEAGEARKKAGDAAERAGNAIERAANAQECSKRIESSNLKLRNDLVSADERLTAEQLKLQEALRDTAKAQRETADLQQKINGTFINRLLDRHVDVRLKESLRSLPPAKAEVRFIESEAVIYALEIRNALAEVGWSVTIVPLPALPTVAGVTIFNKSVGRYFPFGSPQDLRTAFEFLKIDGKDADNRLVILVVALSPHSMEKDASLGEGEFRIAVGKNVMQNGAPLPPR